MRNKVKIAVVGIGLMGNQHLKAIHLSKSYFHSIVDISDKSRIHAKNLKCLYKNSNNLIKENKPDAVIVATPNQFHENIHQVF